MLDGMISWITALYILTLAANDILYLILLQRSYNANYIRGYLKGMYTLDFIPKNIL